MATLSKKLYIKKNGEAAVSCDIYSTEAEAGSPNLKLKVDGNTCFVALQNLPLVKYPVDSLKRHLFFKSEFMWCYYRIYIPVRFFQLHIIYIIPIFQVFCIFRLYFNFP